MSEKVPRATQEGMEEGKQKAQYQKPQYKEIKTFPSETLLRQPVPTNFPLEQVTGPSAKAGTEFQAEAAVLLQPQMQKKEGEREVEITKVREYKEYKK